MTVKITLACTECKQRTKFSLPEAVNLLADLKIKLS